MSGSTGSTVDQIYLPNLSGTAEYRIDVHAGNLADPATNGEQYALAVSFGAVPEPGSAALILIACGGAFSLHLKRRASRQ
jgi:hypothetical protein